MTGRGRWLVIAGLAGSALAVLPVVAGPWPASPADSLPALLRYERGAVLHGEWWRLLTAHGVHLGPAHLALNLLALGAILLLCRPVLSLAQAGACLLFCALGVSLGLLLFNPEIAWYAGLSGALHGLLVAGGLLLMRGRPEAGLLLIGVLVKLTAEQAGVWTAGTGHWLDMPVVVDAHLYGALAGLCGVTLPALLRRLRALLPRVARVSGS